MSIQGLGNYGALSDDFMASQYFKQFAGTAQSAATSGYYNIPQIQGNYYQQPQVDTFQKQDGSTVGAGILNGLAAGAATGAGLYYFGTKPAGEKELTKGFVNEFNKEYVKNLRNKATEEALKARNIKADTLQNLSEFSKSGDTAKLSKDAADYLSSKGLSGSKEDAAKALKEIKDEIAGKVDIHDVSLQNQKLAQYNNLENTFKNLPDRKKATLEKFLTDNADEFGLKGADDTATKTNIQNYLKDKKAVNKIKTHINTKIQTQKQAAENASNVLDEVFKLWNKDKKAFNTASTTEITKACENGLKNFKLKTAGKWGAAIAAAAAIGTWLFGSSSNKTEAKPQGYYA